MTPPTETKVIKRDGTKTPLDLDKIHKMVELACDGLAGVSESAVEMNSQLQLFDGIKTSDIQEILIRSANDLISLEAPNYQYVAARLLLFSLGNRYMVSTQTVVLIYMITFRNALSKVCMMQVSSANTQKKNLIF